jgi:hypothetical protein
MYAIINNNNVIQTLLKWNPRMINSILQEELELDIKVYFPDEANVPWIINEETKIFQVREIKPEYNPKIEELTGPSWEITENIAIANYEVKPLLIEIAKANLIKQLSSERKSREAKSIKITVKGQEVTVNTDRESRAVYASKILSIGDLTAYWKFPETWMEITKSDLEYIISEIDKIVQVAFDWEFAKLNEIENAADHISVNNIIIKEVLLPDRIKNTTTVEG